MGSCLDLRQYQEVDAIQDAFSKIVSGKSGYKAVIERRKDPVKCPQCGLILREGEKFCPECGTKIEIKQRPSKCPNMQCAKPLGFTEKFCTYCGEKI
jgi:DNA-directed RNA polymerase subunit RPC12/RpoP